MSDFKDRFKWEGGRVPSVNPQHLAATWKVMGEVQDSASTTKTIGLGVVLARAGLSAREVKVLSTVEGGGFAFVIRSQLLQSLVQRGVLQQYASGSELHERVFRAVASFPFTEEEFGEATVLLHLKNLPAEKSAQLRSSLISEGYNPEEPKVDSKFLEWIRTQQ